MGLRLMAIGAIGRASPSSKIIAVTSGRPQMGLRLMAIGAIGVGRWSAQMMTGTAAGGPIKILIRGSGIAGDRWSQQMGRSPEEVLLFM